MTVDLYSIPEGIFGPIDPELPALIGRVVMLSALLETRVEAIAGSVDNKLQSEYAADEVGKNIRLAKSRLTHYQADDRERAFAAATTLLLDEIVDALATRNEIVHRVWPHSGVNEWAGWKPMRKKDRNSIEWTDWRVFPRQEFLDLVSTMVQLVARASDVISTGGSIPRRG